MKENEYELPDPDKPEEWVRCLMLSYKTLKGWDYADREWDKDNFTKFCKSAKRILEICGSLRAADSCLMDYARIKEDQDRGSWYLHNVVTFAYEWIAKKRSFKSGANNPYRARLFKDVAERKRNRGSDGLRPASETLPDSLGGFLASETGNKNDSSGKSD